MHLILLREKEKTHSYEKGSNSFSVKEADTDISKTICDVTRQNQTNVGICHLPQINF